MEVKKNPKANLEKRKFIFLQIGLVIVLSACLLAFEWTVSETNIEHDFNINLPMNRLMIKLLVQTGELSPEQKNYIYD